MYLSLWKQTLNRKKTALLLFAPNLSWNDIENEDNFHEAYSNFFPSDNNLPLNNALISDTKLQFDGNHAETFENNSLLPLEQTSAAETNLSFFDDSIPDDFFLQFFDPSRAGG